MEAIQTNVIERQEHLCKLAAFCRELDAALRATGIAPEQSREIFGVAVSAECVGCGLSVSGEELYALSQSPSAELASVKTGRLRLGDCARQGCEAWYYRVFLTPHGQIDWPRLLSQLDVQNKGRHDRDGAVTRLRNLVWQRVLRSQLLLRVGLAFGVILVALLARHWVQGGRIPLLREPEQFQVDTGPEEEGMLRSAEEPGTQ